MNNIENKYVRIFIVDPSNYPFKSIAEGLEERVDSLQSNGWIIDNIIETKSKFDNEQAFIIVAHYQKENK